MSERWLIYGAYGYTGRLAAQAAVEAGSRPLLSGRDPARLQPLAERLGLEWTAASLDDAPALARLLERVDVVYHAAGPFTFTARPMLQACLQTRTHYLDITGEISVFQHTFSLHQQAVEQGVTLISGCGFDVIPSDCLVAYVAGRTPAYVAGRTPAYVAGRSPSARWLETAIAGGSTTSAGTAKSGLEMLPGGALRRREGELVSRPFGQGARRVAFPDHPRTVIPAPWGDLVTAYHLTGIPNITCYLAYPSKSLPWLRRLGPLLQAALRFTPLRRAVQRLAQAALPGPSQQDRQEKRSYIWARVGSQAAGENGNDPHETQAWLETPEAYHFTAQAALPCVRHLLASPQPGALTPAQAFGADFVLSLPGVRRLDRLDTV